MLTGIKKTYQIFILLVIMRGDKLKSLINLFRTIVNNYDDKHSRHKLIYCNDKWENNPHRTRKEKKEYRNAYLNSPGCRVHLDNRCCLYCPRIKTCKFKCQRGCYEWKHLTYGKPIKSKYEYRKLSKENFINLKSGMNLNYSMERK